MAGVYAAIALASGLDRASATHPGLANPVPSVLQARAPREAARRFVIAGLAAPALAPARRALAADPADPEPAALYGAALLARGRSVEAGQAFRLAARLGWREPLTQLYWLESALRSGDTRNAVIRFDALARQYPAAPAVTAAADRIEASEAGRAALAAQIARGAGWAAGYADLDARAGAARLERRSAVLRSAAGLGRPLGCAATQKIVTALTPADPLQAAALWRESCPDAAAAETLADGGFERLALNAARVPFEWDLAGHGALEAALVAVKPPGSGQALQLRSSAATPLPVLAQLVALAPGRYRVSWLGGAGRVGATLACARDETRGALSVGGQSAEFVIDAACPARWLRLWLAPGSEAVTLDEVRIEKL